MNFTMWNISYKFHCTGLTELTHTHAQNSNHVQGECMRNVHTDTHTHTKNTWFKQGIKYKIRYSSVTLYTQE